tara:strand:+ start:1234 stop:4338 length:3105 start_codon:yes stop_codon:yes gene_type:complete
MAIRVKDLPDATDSDISGSDEIVIDRSSGTANATISQIRTFVLATDSSNLESISDDHENRIDTIEGRFTTDSVKIDNVSSGGLEIARAEGRVLPQGDFSIRPDSSDPADAVVEFEAFEGTYEFQVQNNDQTWSVATTETYTTSGHKTVTLNDKMGDSIRVVQTSGVGSSIVRIDNANGLEVGGAPVAFDTNNNVKSNSDGTQSTPAFNLNDNAGWHYEESNLKLSIGNTEVLRVGASTYNPRVSAVFQSDVTFIEQGLFSAGTGPEAPGIAFTGKTDTGIARDGDAIKLFSTKNGETANGFTSLLASFSPDGLSLNKDTTFGNLTGTTIDSAEYKTSKDDPGYTFYDGVTKKAGLTYSEYALNETTASKVALDVDGEDFLFEKLGGNARFTCDEVAADIIGDVTANNVDVNTTLRVMEDGALTDITSRMITSAERIKLASIDLNELGSGDMTQGFATLRVTTVDGSTQTNLTDIDVDTATDKRLTLKLDEDEFSATTNNTTNTIELGLSSKVVTEDNISSKLPSNVLTTSSDIDIDRLPAAVLTTSDTIDADQIQGRAVASTAPNADEVLTWNGSAWAPAATNVDNSAGIRLPASSIGQLGSPALRFGGESGQPEYGLTRHSSLGLVTIHNGTIMCHTEGGIPSFPQKIRVRNYSSNSLSIRSFDNDETGIGMDNNNVVIRNEGVNSIESRKEFCKFGGGIRKKVKKFGTPPSQGVQPNYWVVVNPGDSVIVLNASSRVQLPLAAGVEGMEVTIIAAPTASSVTVSPLNVQSPSGGATNTKISGYSSIVLNAGMSSVLICDGSDWHVVGSISAPPRATSRIPVVSQSAGSTSPTKRWNLAVGNRGAAKQDNSFPVGSPNDVWNNTTGSNSNFGGQSKYADGSNSPIGVDIRGLNSWRSSGGNYPTDIMEHYVYSLGSNNNAYIDMSNVPAGTYDIYIYGAVYPNSTYSVSQVASQSVNHRVYVSNNSSNAVATLQSSRSTDKYTQFDTEGKIWVKTRVTHTGGSITIKPIGISIYQVINAITLQEVNPTTASNS